MITSFVGYRAVVARRLMMAHRIKHRARRQQAKGPGSYATFSFVTWGHPDRRWPRGQRQVAQGPETRRGGQNFTPGMVCRRSGGIMVSPLIATVMSQTQWRP